MGAAEQNVDRWLEALRHVVASLARGVDPHQWGGVGLVRDVADSGHTRCGWGSDWSGLARWQDARAEAFGDALRDEVGADALYSSTGQWVDGRYLVPMWRRIVAADPERARRTSTICGAKDYLFRLT